MTCETVAMSFFDWMNITGGKAIVIGGLNCRLMTPSAGCVIDVDTTASLDGRRYGIRFAKPLNIAFPIKEEESYVQS